MQNFELRTLPKALKLMLFMFCLSLAFGYFSGFKYLFHTTDLKASGIEQNYLGNEEELEAEILQFKKSEQEILTIVHTHSISMSLIFLALALMLYGVRMNNHWKLFLMTEPFLSIVFTFGGIWMLWKELHFFKYIVMFSGMLMNVSILMMFLLIVRELLGRKTTATS